jgi:hypothetical protein
MPNEKHVKPPGDEKQPDGDKARSHLPVGVQKAIAITGIVATAATILATLAGIFVSLRTMQKDQDLFRAQQAKETTAQLQAKENIADAELARAKLVDQQGTLELNRTQLQVKAEENKARLEADQKTQDRVVSQAEQLGAAIRHFQSGDVTGESEIPIIAEFLDRPGTLRRSALAALEARLKEPRTASEAAEILRVLPSAGLDALDIEARANRKAFSEMEESVSAELVWRVTHSNNSLDAELADSRLGQELFRDRPLSPKARHALVLFPDLLASDKGIRSAGKLMTIEDAVQYRTRVRLDEDALHKHYPIWRSLLEGSTEAIEETLRHTAKVDTLNFNHCLLPSLRITQPIQVRRASFISSYIVGADLRGLSSGAAIALADAAFMLDPTAEYEQRRTSGSAGSPLLHDELNAHGLLRFDIRVPPGAILLPAAKRDTLGMPEEE